jgi:hypothetical protein
MNSKYFNVLIIKYLFLFCMIFSLASGQWSSDPASPQLLGSGVQAQVKATPDGGVYIAWLTDMGGYHVYLQRFNPEGIAQFDDGGLLVSDHDNASWIAIFHMNLDVDSEDNAIITVLDERSGPWNVYAYKIAPDGSMLWGDDGLTLSNSNNANYSPRLAVLPDNSVVVTWSQDLNLLHFQRISAAGNLMWGDGILLENNSSALMSPQPIVDADGAALIQWISQTGPVWAADSKLHLQKYNQDGNPQWSEPTVAAGPVVFPMGNWSQQSKADLDGGSFSAWTKMSGNVQSAVAQHINSIGGLYWLGGVELSINTNAFRMSPQLVVSEDSQELMAVWNESNISQSQRGVYAQRLNGNGWRTWGSNGKAVVPLNNNYVYYDLSAAGFGEEMVTLYIQGNSNNSISDIFATRLDTDGNHAWQGGVLAVTSSGSSKNDMMIGKGQGCVFIAWTENGFVYAHCLKQDGTLGAPDTFISGDINTDGNIDILDVVMLVNHIINENISELDDADINNDGDINILDVVALINIILSN